MFWGQYVDCWTLGHGVRRTSGRAFGPSFPLALGSINERFALKTWSIIIGGNYEGFNLDAVDKPEFTWDVKSKNTVYIEYNKTKNVQ